MADDADKDLNRIWDNVENPSIKQTTAPDKAKLWRFIWVAMTVGTSVIKNTATAHAMIDANTEIVNGFRITAGTLGSFSRWGASAILRVSGTANNPRKAKPKSTKCK